eukprot:TRINITY_DN4668_c0_g2_i2.p1 TRINITY_DN4668_c0_g2~~TRINITY_DN4668_c0_g2_i2.p1  ORF type:complete len:520 (-),score=104.86 TRINITY_DN4668_c0_g2_i2:138-1697(-)
MARSNSTLALAAGATVTLAIALRLRRRLKASAEKDASRSPPSGGSALSIFFKLIRAKSLSNLILELRELHGDVFTIAIPPIFPRSVIVTDIESVHAITALEGRLDMSITLPPAYEALHGKDLQLTKGKAHKIWRRVLSSVISPRAIQSYLPRLVSAFDGMWRDLAANGNEVVLVDHVRRTQLRVMADILYGVTFDNEQDFQRLDEDFETETAGLFAAPINLPGFTFGKAMRAAKRLRVYLTELLRREVEKQRSSPAPAASDANSKQRPLRSAIEAIVELHLSTDDEVRELVANEELVVNNLLLLLEASQGTTMLATTAMLGELHKDEHRAALDLAKAEIRELDARLDGSVESVEDLNKLDFLDGIVNEALRLYPFAGQIPKFLPAGKTLEVGGYVIQGPIDVQLSFSHMFEDPSVFPCPQEFRPERWVPNAPDNIGVSDAAKRAFLPFGLGPHVCLGQNFARLSMKVALMTLFRRGYDVKLIAPFERVPDILPTVRTHNGVRAKVVAEDPYLFGGTRAN